ncbi:MAG: hypothetical protein OXK79_07455 [Chloroflexota bacterium]|nr:hypothetical protein [Chloroflexota bacterium]
MADRPASALYAARLIIVRDDAPKYAKPLDTYPAPWCSSSFLVADSEFVLRITLGKMPIEDGFWMALPDDLSSLSLGELFKRVFPSDRSLQQTFLQRLDVKGNPDLPEMYDALVEVFIREELDLCTVDTYVNHGPKLEDSAVVSRHLTKSEGPPVLDLVLEQRFSAIDYAVRREDFRDAGEALTWMSSRVLLYFVGALEYVLPTEPDDNADTALLPIAQSLVEEGLVERPADSGTFEITELGMEALHEMTAEAENVIERYEVFADVLCDPESGECDFGTGAGIDLRIPVYEAEGLSPVRVVLLVELCGGEFVRIDVDWRLAIQDREFFEALLPVVERPLVDAQDLDAIIDAGFAYMEQQAHEASLANEDAQLRRSLDPY